MAKKSKKLEVTIKGPEIFPRGKKGLYSLRIRSKKANVDKWVSLGTTDYDKALIDAKSVLKAETQLATIEHKDDAERDRAISEALKDKHNIKDSVAINLSDAHQKWVEHTRSHSNLAERSQKHYALIFRKFAEWCDENGIKNVHEVDVGIAKRYAKFLWDSGIGGKTFNDHLRHLSRVFSAIDTTVSPLIHRNPFHHELIPRIKNKEINTISHEPLEPDELKKVINKSAEYGKDYRDLILVGSQTGLRLVDVIMLDWKDISGQFIELIPRKTRRKGNKARIPITGTLDKVLQERSKQGRSGYIFKELVNQHDRNSFYISQTCKKIFIEAFKDYKDTQAAGEHRKRRASIYSFHSLRVTYMSLLAEKDVSIRDAKKILAWESDAMVKLYERMLERAKGDFDRRLLQLVKEVGEFNLDLPASIQKIKPTKEILESLVQQYSNITIGKIYAITEAAIRKHIKKHGIVREKRIESADITDEQIEKIREELKDAQ